MTNHSTEQRAQKVPHDYYQRWNKTDTEKRFWDRVDKQGNSECWPWLGPRHKNGYGFDRDKRFFDQYYPHRAAYIFTHGSIPGGLHILHRCDNRICCNPAHLFAGTNNDNIVDKVAKSRQPRGETHGIAKLTVEQVVEIRRRYKEGNITMLELGKQYGVGGGTISAVIRRENWQWVD